MNRARRRFFVMGCAVTMFAAAAHGADRPGVAPGSPQLKMEELEVRGMRERPETLFLSVPKPISIPTPVPFDLFKEDIAKPVFPRDRGTDNTPDKGVRHDGD